MATVGVSGKERPKVSPTLREGTFFNPDVLDCLFVCGVAYLLDQQSHNAGVLAVIGGKDLLQDHCVSTHGLFGVSISISEDLKNTVDQIDVCACV